VAKESQDDPDGPVPDSCCPRPPISLELPYLVGLREASRWKRDSDMTKHPIQQPQSLSEQGTIITGVQEPQG
jgi:hypothetical protein